MSRFLQGVALVGCVLAGPMAGVAPASAQQPSCDDWGTYKFFENADPAMVARCLDAGADVHARDDHGDTPLHEAASDAANSAVIIALLDAGADIHARDQVGETPLHHAAYANDNPAIITVLVDAGADVHARDQFGDTPLHHAAYVNFNPAIITVLVDAGADVHVRNQVGDTPLHEGAEYSDTPAVITALLAAGGDPHAQDDFGNTPRQLAGERPAAFLAAFSAEAIAAFREEQRQEEAAARQQEVDRQLREARVSCDKWNTPTFYRHAGADDVTRCLATNDPNETDDQGRTPMHLAALEGRPEVMAALTEAGADPNALDDNGRTPLHLVAYFGTNPETVAALVQAGADITALDAKGRTPLEFAEKFSEAPAIVAALRDAVAAASSPPEPGPSAAGVASVSCENWNTARFFRNATVEDLARCLETEDPNARNASGRTPMHYAAQGASPAFVTALAGAGAELNAPDDKGGWTPLHLAAWFGPTPSVVAALLAAGADPAVRDGAGKVPWDYARENAALEGTPPYWRLQEEGSE